jgi:hypothetical protein
MRAWSLVVVTAACGRINIDERPPSDAVPDAGAAPDCGPSTVFTDDLDDTMPGPLFGAQTNPSISLLETAGHLELTFAPNVAPKTMHST